MRRVALVLVLLLSHLPAAPAEPVAAPRPGLMCRSAIAAAEANAGLPPQLMAAIGRVESGRPDPATGAVLPWPWTIDAEGQGSFFDTKAQAIAAVQALQARGVRSIDVGCMQVNLMHHPDAFASLEAAFDPTTNATYAARLLNELHAQTSDWPRAVALYHSATPDLALAYQHKVMAAWPEERRLAGGTPLLAQAGSAAPHLMLQGGMFQVGMFQGGALLHTALPASTPHAAAPLGRDLASYRARPIMLATRPPRGAGG